MTEPVITRSIPTPDGQTQLVAMPANGWECLDWMIAEMGERLDQIVQICWDFVQENPEENFMTAFNFYVHTYMMKYLAKRHGLANDNNAYADPNWPQKPRPAAQV